jgi:hypothetical protein
MKNKLKLGKLSITYRKGDWFLFIFGILMIINMIKGDYLWVIIDVLLIIWNEIASLRDEIRYKY